MKQLGALYIILGTCIAAGLLGMPIVTASGTFGLTTLMIISAWILMSFGAWCLLQVNLWLPPESNMVSMAEATLGKTVKAITWVIYLALLYSLICAYLAAAGDIAHALLHDIHIDIPRWGSTVFAAVLIGLIVYRGIRGVDLVNRLLMTVKLAILIAIIALVTPHVHLAHLSEGNFHWKGSTWLVIICSFGYAIIIPSIRVYLHSDKKVLNRVVMMGSFIPMIIYLIWTAVIQGALPHAGAHGLIAMNHAADTNSMLMSQLVDLTHHPLLDSISVLFVSICAITGLLGVSISLTDFLSDGLNMPKKGWNTAILVTFALLPALLVVIIDPAIFTSALAYAGFFCLYVLVALPIAMYFIGKKNKVALRYQTL